MQQHQPYSEFDRPDFDRSDFDGQHATQLSFGQPQQEYPPPPAQHVAPAQSFDYPYPSENRPSSIAEPAAKNDNNSPLGRFRNMIVSTQEIFSKRWQRYFLLLMLAQAVTMIALEADTFALFQNSLVEDYKDRLDGTDLSQQRIHGQLLAIPTFLTLFILGFLYQSWLAWDALQAKNTIQVIGCVIANGALFVYATIQIEDIHEAVTILEGYNIFLSQNHIWLEMKPVLISIPVIIAVATVGLGWIAWKLYQDFAWDILKIIGADYRMKKRFLHYQIYIALLKFDFFFFIGFTVQFLVVVGGKGTLEKTLTAIAIPITVVILVCAAWFTRREWKPGMLFIMVLYLGALAYFIFKLSRIYDPFWSKYYKAVKKSLTAYAVVTILLIIMTITNGMICFFNFGKGLKEHINASRVVVDKDQVSYSLSDVKTPNAPSRMTID